MAPDAKDLAADGGPGWATSYVELRHGADQRRREPPAMGTVVMCPPPLLDAAGLAKLRADFGDWDVHRDHTGRLVAEHLTEEPDAARERWILKTRVVAATAEQLHVLLCIQEAVRGKEVPR